MLKLSKKILFTINPPIKEMAAFDLIAIESVNAKYPEGMLKLIEFTPSPTTTKVFKPETSQLAVIVGEELFVTT